jgi:hypothetical protein
LLTTRSEERVEGRYESINVHIPSLARRFDLLLFKKASSLEEYVCVATLNDRLRKLLARMFRRCIHKARPPKETRKQTLIQTVGRDRYQEISDLVHEINRLKYGATLFALPQSIPHTIRTGADTGCFHSCFFGGRDSTPDQPTGIPAPVRDLYYHTPIVRAFENTPFGSFYQVPWDDLYRQGKTSVKIYRSWRASLSKNVEHVAAATLNNTPKPIEATDICPSNNTNGGGVCVMSS